MSVKPTMPPRMLLKSWAMPPARVPMASIFWAWRMRVSTSASWVMSRCTLMKWVMAPAESRTGETVVAAMNRLPSRRRLTSRPRQTSP